MIVMILAMIAALGMGALDVYAAEPPTIIQQQGRVLDSNGLVVDGLVPASIRVYDSDLGGSLVWSESTDIDVNEGVFNVEFGDALLSAALTNASQAWLELEFDGVVQTPRLRLSAVPYALRAGVAQELITPLAGVPSGGIAIWSGARDTIPEGWVLCDGDNGTPDMRDRFVMGARDGFDPGSIGGANSYTLTAAQLPAHSHGAASAAAGSHSHSASTSTAGNHNHGGADGDTGNHNHTFRVSNSYGCGGGHEDKAGGSNWSGNQDFNTHSAGNHEHSSHTLNTIGNHTHSVTVNAAGDHSHTITIESTGNGDAIDNRPAFYALAFVMKQ